MNSNGPGHLLPGFQPVMTAGTPGQPGFQPGTCGEPSTRVEISVSAKQLLNKDLVSRSDPMCVLFRGLDGNRWVEEGRTEQIVDSPNPVWDTKFILDYRFEQRQMLKFEIYDIDSKSTKLEDHDFLGHVICSLGEIVSGQSRGFKRNLEKGQGILFIASEEMVESNQIIRFQLSAKDLDKKDFFGKSDPYFEIFRTSENENILVHRSEVIKKTLNPSWRELTLPVSQLCMADPDRTLIFIFKKKKKKGAKYKDSGTIKFNKCSVEEQPSFLEYISKGTMLNFTLAVDFTGSNGAPSNPTSLHYRDPSGKPNQYLTSIHAVGEIVQDYDYDQQFPALGFGARVPPHGQVSHEFFLNIGSPNPFCQGLQGIVSAYYTALNQVQLYGPTNFSPVINHVAKFAAAYQNDPSNYFILLILTDGIITDMVETKQAIIAASALPMSIIIIGVGEADFSEMEELDCDGGLLSSHGHNAKRDIVQFVEMRRFLYKNQHGGQGWDKETLAKEFSSFFIILN
ncbi:copine-3 [Eurytemora carolleeae]|uniref:copine-3 n=1 Tax=Eurytemora carolleeae TaxID=1294199 RepID=UPI000C77B0FF|nr:copine-3 [Eurytemora carolleeae]|eukprot:XP_023339050.1 copine-3-like [Eurytemora affinis]